MVHALVINRIDYCNSLLYGIPQTPLVKLKRVQNAAAHLICKVSRFDHITPVLFSLHWLPVNYRITFKVLLVTYKAIHGIAHVYIQDLIKIREKSVYSLRSNSEILLENPRTMTKPTLGNRAFTAVAPKLWNSLPSDIRNTQSVDTFKRALKTYLFKTAFGI